MAVLILRAPSSGGSAFVPDAGWSAPTGTFAPGGTFSITRDAADLGTGPTINLFANFRGGTVGNSVPTTQTVGAFTEMTVGGGVGAAPRYATGPDGDTWMNMMSPALGVAGDWGQANIGGMPDFDTIYLSYQFYADFTSGQQGSLPDTTWSGSNQKDVWINRNGEVGGLGHDIYTGANQGLFTNSTGGGNPAQYFADDGHTNYHRRNEQTFRSLGLKPTTTAAVGALYSCFAQVVNSFMRFQDIHNGEKTTWNSASTTPAWNHVYLLGDYQDQDPSHTAEPPHLTYYLIKDYYIATGANAWKRFFITDASTLAASRSFFDCRHTAWSGSGVTLAMPYGWSGTKYLWYGNGTTYTRVGVL